MQRPTKLLFLPGASGSTAFWQPLANLLEYRAEKQIVSYPGFGTTPADPCVDSIDDLVQRIVKDIDQPTALIAQSMGGILAVRLALELPNLITHLVLSATSGGLDTRALGATDWRPEFVKANPCLPPWFLSFESDLSSEIGRISQPVLLLWGDADPFSPVAVGKKLLALLPNAELRVINGGHHDLAHEYAGELAPIVREHLLRAYCD
ncbi:alpha/beta fold hydrolase [Achromobacter sp. UMC71]|uniref:alpha/beta fold hydrolase n=1 Tax=Achromobacter sp. UMC71 TaxID=1862320 RepID=UPI001600504F|nr:alpha/beta hydrolase [Achromobacter sp. UMC71]MBB1626384.1 alpha/beta hydrolase [Achromobacter sp. UMC71]